MRSILFDLFLINFEGNYAEPKTFFKSRGNEHLGTSFADKYGGKAFPGPPPKSGLPLRILPIGKYMTYYFYDILRSSLRIDWYIKSYLIISVHNPKPSRKTDWFNKTP